MANRLDGFFFDVDKWFADLVAQRMSFSEKGVYLTMLFQQWRDGSKSLPDSPRELADLIAVTDAQGLEIEQAWPVVRRKFVSATHDPMRIVNLKVEKTRRQQAANQRKREQAGRAAGLASAAKRKQRRELPANESLTTVERSSTDKKRVEEKRSDQIRRDREPARAIASTADAAPEARLLDAFRLGWQRVYGHECSLLVSPLEQMKLEQQVAAIGETKLLRALGAFFETEEAFVRKARHPLPLFLREPLRFMAAESQTPSKPRSCKHEPPCVDDAAHTKRYLAEQESMV
jgi:uncharacterized protein YdaU (DUF1376 family)